MGEVHDFIEAKLRKFNELTPEQQQKNRDARRIVDLTYMIRFPEDSRFEQESRAELEELKRKYNLSGEEEWIDAAVEAQKQWSDDFDRRIKERNKQYEYDRERDASDPVVIANREIAIDAYVQSFRLIDNEASEEEVTEALERAREALMVLPNSQRFGVRELAHERRDQEISQEEIGG